MAAQDNSLGLLSKVAKFVRHPTTHWRDLDKVGADSPLDAEASQAYNRQTLKNMIERKRHEDAVRQQEFDQLRQLRRAASRQAPVVPDRLAPQEDSGPIDLDDRSLTIRKIDEIEAQMSKQWWKGQAHVAPPEPGPPDMPAPAPVSEASCSFAPTQVFEVSPDLDADTTQTGQAFDMPDPPDFGAVAASASLEQPLLAVSGESPSDPELEEAAVRFANGDDVGAESVLLTALQSRAVFGKQVETQANALFDFYCSLGMQASFEREAINYARQYDRPAPRWRVYLAAQSVASEATPLTLTDPSVWQCPGELTPQALAALPRQLSATDDLCLDWTSLQRMTPEAAQTLADLLALWCGQQGRIRFAGASVLDQILRAATPMGAPETPAFWWQLRLDLLRLLGWQDEFVQAALGYCFTYDLAPPPWQPALCQCLSDSPEAEADRGEGVRAAPASVEFTGELLGDAAPALALLDRSRSTAKDLVISCHQLVRVDFSVAGSLLTWVASAHEQGCRIEFRAVPCLVAALFNLIGINQHTQVSARQII